MDEQQTYQIIITSSAESSYFDVLNYVYANHSLKRADEIAIELLEFPQILKKFPRLGKIEPDLRQRTEDYRHIIYKRTNKATVKIIYYADRMNKKIYLTDFFPTELFEQKIKLRK